MDQEKGLPAAVQKSPYHSTAQFRALASLLPRLVADIADKDRWTTAEIISRLRWVSPTGVIHPHIFPVDSAVRSNRVTEEALFSAFESIDRGYIALLGPPGSGKSTLLQAGLFPTPRASILRYLAFVPDEGHGLGRAEAIDFLHDIVTQLTRQNLRVNIFPGTDLTELRSQLAALLLAAGERYNSSGIKTIIIVDGLDHIPREERPNRSLLSELPLPQLCRVAWSSFWVRKDCTWMKCPPPLVIKLMKMDVVLT